MIKEGGILYLELPAISQRLLNVQGQAIWFSLNFMSVVFILFSVGMVFLGYNEFQHGSKVFGLLMCALGVPMLCVVFISRKPLLHITDKGITYKEFAQPIKKFLWKDVVSSNVELEVVRNGKIRHSYICLNVSVSALRHQEFKLPMLLLRSCANWQKLVQALIFNLAVNKRHIRFSRKIFHELGIGEDLEMGLAVSPQTRKSFAGDIRKIKPVTTQEQKKRISKHQTFIVASFFGALLFFFLVLWYIISYKLNDLWLLLAIGVFLVICRMIRSEKRRFSILENSEGNNDSFVYDYICYCKKESIQPK